MYNFSTIDDDVYDEYNVMSNSRIRSILKGQTKIKLQC